MQDYIRIPSGDVIVVETPETRELRIKITSMTTLDSIIEQCRDIKLKLLEAKNNGQNAQM